MKRAFILIAFSLFLASCGTTSTQLYNWGRADSHGVTDYDRLSYDYYHKQTPASICNLLVGYEKMINSPGGARQVPPPGVCAEYGYLLLNPETSQAFIENATDSQKAVYGSSDLASSFRERGLMMMQKEIELYPESRRFIEPLLKKLSE